MVRSSGLNPVGSEERKRNNHKGRVDVWISLNAERNFSRLPSNGSLKPHSNTFSALSVSQPPLGAFSEGSRGRRQRVCKGPEHQFGQGVGGCVWVVWVQIYDLASVAAPNL